MSRRKHSDPATPPAPAANPFAALEGLRGTLPPGSAEPAGKEPTAPLFDTKVVLARERKGRGGKTVTVVRGVLLEDAALEEFARGMRRALGTGGHIEERAIVLAGDQIERAARWLRDKGAARVVIGN